MNHFLVLQIFWVPGRPRTWEFLDSPSGTPFHHNLCLLQVGPLGTIPSGEGAKFGGREWVRNNNDNKILESRIPNLKWQYGILEAEWEPVHGHCVRQPFLHLPQALHQISEEEKEQPNGELMSWSIFLIYLFSSRVQIENKTERISKGCHCGTSLSPEEQWLLARYCCRFLGAPVCESRVLLLLRDLQICGNCFRGHRYQSGENVNWHEHRQNLRPGVEQGSRGQSGCFQNHCGQ